MRSRISSKELSYRIEVIDVAGMLQVRMRWLEHLEREDHDDWVYACRHQVVPNVRRGNRGRKTKNLKKNVSNKI